LRKLAVAEMTIRLRCDSVTGKKDIVVTLRSDEDALPHEHEQRHQALVDRLIQGGVLKASEVGQIVVEREQPEGRPAGSQPADSLPEPRAHSEGSS
jgi:hypothetical protein